MNLISTIIASIAVFFSSLFGISNNADISSLRLDVNHLQETVSQNVGATNAIPTPIALFETTLAGNISSSATSMTLTSANDKTGTALASSTYAFILDEGSASEEMVLADCTGTACTNMTRGINVITGTSTTASLQFAHRRGASVKITDGPQIMILTRIINGIGSFPNPLTLNGIATYSSAPSFTPGSNQLITATYADSIANAGAATSTETNGGLVELGTLAEQADTFSGGANKPTVLQTKNSTSTCQVVGSYNIVASSTTGKLDKNCFDQTGSYTLTGTNILSGVTTLSGGYLATASSTHTATTTFTGKTIGANIFTTLTASTTITGATTPQPIYIATSTGALQLSDADLTPAFFFDGFAVSSGNNGDSIIVQTDGIVGGFSGLTTGSGYYVQDVGGTMGTSIGTVEVYVGKAISTTQIFIDRNRDWQYITSQALSVGANTISFAGQQYRYTVINAVCGLTGNPQADLVLTKKGKTSGSIIFPHGGTPFYAGVNASVSGNTLTLSDSGGVSCTTISGTAYYYK